MSKALSATRLETSTFAELLRWRAFQQPERPAYTFLRSTAAETRSLSYRELDWQARCIAGNLQRLGQ